MGLALLSAGLPTYAQRPGKPALRNSFGGSQWYVGVEAGPNFTRVRPQTPFHEYYRIAEMLDHKAYQPRWTNSGQQVGIQTVYRPARQLSISLSALYKTSRYGYQQQFVWEEPDMVDQRISINYHHTVQLTYLEFPLTVRYHLFSTGKIRLFLSGGGYYGRLLQASKQMTESGEDWASGGQTAYVNPTSATLVKDMFDASHRGYLWGGGIVYQPGTLTLTLELMQQQSLHSIPNPVQRYQAARNLPGFGNVQDDLSLSTLQASVALLFPLKFLTKSFQPVTF